MPSLAWENRWLIDSLVDRQIDISTGMKELWDSCQRAFPTVAIDLRQFESMGWSRQEVDAWAEQLDQAGAWGACGMPIKAWIFEITQLAGDDGSTIPAIDLVGAQWTDYWDGAEDRNVPMFSRDEYRIAPVTLTKLWQMRDTLPEGDAHDLYEYTLPLGYVALAVKALLRGRDLSMFRHTHVYAAWSGADCVRIHPEALSYAAELYKKHPGRYREAEAEFIGR